MDSTDTSTQTTAPSRSLEMFRVEQTEHRSAPSTWLDSLPPQTSVLRPYQLDLLTRLMAALGHCRRVLAQAPTGAGKSHLIASLVAAALLGDLRILILATRTRLVRQLHERMDDFKLPHGIMAASLPGLTNWSRPIQIASVDTLYRRCLVDKRMPLPPADLVIFDEAHLALGSSRRAILNSYPLAWHVGFTATPAKTSGVALDEQFDELVLGPSVSDLIALRALCSIRIFAKPVMSKRELGAVAKDSKTGDYATGELSALMSRPKLVGDVVENWLRIANGKRTIVFACDKKHGAQIREEFSRAGVACEQLTDNDPEDVREEVIARLEGGVTQVLVNCFLLSYGIDIPSIECIVIARPTRSVVLYLQCLDAKTEILTRRGFVGPDEVKDDDEVASFNLDNDVISFGPIISRVDRALGEDESMFALRSPSIDIRVTSGHRMVYRTKRFGSLGKTGWRVDTASVLHERAAEWELPVSGNETAMGLPLTDDELRFIGWFLTDGSLNSRTNAISIYQAEHQPWREAIDECLVGCGFKYTLHKRVSNTKYNASSRICQYTISKGAPRLTGKNLSGWGKLEPYIDKDLSPALDEINETQLKVLLEAIHLGDGSKQSGQTWTRRSYHITSGRKTFADRLQSLCIRRGWRCNIAQRKDQKVWDIHIKQGAVRHVGGTGYKDRPSLTATPYTKGERVWCVETKDGTLVTRRNGMVSIVGNCVGRGMRTSPGKDHMILIDHGRVVDNLGLPTYERDWSLKGENVNTQARDRFSDDRKTGDEKPRTCAECSRMWVVTEDGSRCPSCGWHPTPKAQPVQVTQAYLGEIGAVLPSVETTEQFYREACDWYSTRWPDRWQSKEKSGRWWAWMQTREKFKRPEDERMPSMFWNLPPVHASPETAGWLKSKIIAFAKAKKAA